MNKINNHFLLFHKFTKHNNKIKKLNNQMVSLYLFNKAITTKKNTNIQKKNQLNSIHSKITREKLCNNEQVANEQVANVQIANEQVANVQIANEQVANVQIANEQVANEQVANVQIANEQVANVQIANEQVANLQIANEQVAKVQIANEQVANEQVANVQIANEQVANEQVANLQIANEQVTTDALNKNNDYHKNKPIVLKNICTDELYKKVSELIDNFNKIQIDYIDFKNINSSANNLTHKNKQKLTEQLIKYVTI
jgi:hypothetical protein